MGRRRNKLRNAAGFIGLSIIRQLYRIVKIAHIGSRTRYEDQFLYAKVQLILVPPYFQLVPPHLVCSGDGTAKTFFKFVLTFQQNELCELLNFRKKKVLLTTQID